MSKRLLTENNKNEIVKLFTLELLGELQNLISTRLKRKNNTDTEEYKYQKYQRIIELTNNLIELLKIKTEYETLQELN